MGHVHPCSIVMLVYQRVFLIWHTPRIDISADFVEYKFLLGYHNPQWGMPINQPVKWLCNGAAAQFVRVNLNGTWLVTGPISSREYPRRNSTINWNHIEWNACWLIFEEKMVKFPHGPPFFSPSVISLAGVPAQQSRGTPGCTGRWNLGRSMCTADMGGYRVLPQ